MPKDATAVPGFELGTSSMEVRGLHTVRLDRSATTAPRYTDNFFFTLLFIAEFNVQAL